MAVAKLHMNICDSACSIAPIQELCAYPMLSEWNKPGLVDSITVAQPNPAQLQPFVACQWLVSSRSGLAESA